MNSDVVAAECLECRLAWVETAGGGWELVVGQDDEGDVETSGMMAVWEDL